MLLDGFMGPLTKPQTKSLKTIVSATNRMNETISTLLNITRIESGSVAVAKKPVSLPQIAEEVISEHRLAATDKGVKLKLNRSNKPLRIISDGVVLKEILSNLLSNGIKYTPEGGTVTVVISTKGNQVILSVADTGVGIPPESQKNVFSKFFRADNVVKQETSGTGLGLYLVKGLVMELNGDVWFESEEDKGSTFYISLPLLPQSIRTQTVKK